MSAAKVILWDLEVTNLNANFGYLLCAGYKELGEAKPHVISITDFPTFKRDPTNDYHVVKATAEVLATADVFVTHYGVRFDLPYLNARLLHHKLPVLPPIKHIDTWRISRDKLKLNSNRLASISAFLGLEEKTPLDGPVWVRAAAGHRPSVKYVVSHCLQDVIVLEQTYLRLRPLMLNHPNMTLLGQRSIGCPTCGGTRIQRRGTSVTKTRTYKRFQCQECGAWCRDSTCLSSVQVTS